MVIQLRDKVKFGPSSINFVNLVSQVSRLMCLNLVCIVSQLPLSYNIYISISWSESKQMIHQKKRLIALGWHSTFDDATNLQRTKLTLYENKSFFFFFFFFCALYENRSWLNMTWDVNTITFIRKKKNDNYFCTFNN